MRLERNMLAYCGIYCEQCSGRAAHAEQDWKHLEHFPARFRKGRPDLADYACEGCKGHNICGECGIRVCASAREFASCAECDDFPCPMLDAFGNDGVPHHEQALENLEAIREQGVEAWFAEIRKRLRCRCGERQSWYYSCPKHS